MHRRLMIKALKAFELELIDCWIGDWLVATWWYAHYLYFLCREACRGYHLPKYGILSILLGFYFWSYLGQKVSSDRNRLLSLPLPVWNKRGICLESYWEFVVVISGRKLGSRLLNRFVASMARSQSALTDKEVIVKNCNACIGFDLSVNLCQSILAGGVMGLLSWLLFRKRYDQSES